MAAVLSTAGCASSGGDNLLKGTVQTLSETQREVDRTFREPFADKQDIKLTQGQAVHGPGAKPYDQAQLKLAIERFVAGRKQTAAQYVAAGAVLTPDGRQRVLVLFTSQNWCQPQGCDLAVFEQGSFGWKHAASIGRVRAPIRVSATATAGWFDLWAVTGRDGSGKDKKSFVQNVRLKYGSNGYPGTTTFAISGTQGEPEGQVIFQSAELEVPDKARFATGGRDPKQISKKAKETVDKAIPAAKPSP